MYPAGVSGVRQRHVTLHDGCTVRVVESGPTNGEHAVLLVHGWAASVYTFCETLAGLAAAGHRAIAFDLPGHGLSDKPADESRYTTQALADAVLAVATAMELRRFTFVGHSMGGSLGLHLAIRGEPRLERLALINSIGLGSVPVIVPLRVLSPRPIDRIIPALLTRPTIRSILQLAFGTPERPTERDINEYWAPTQFPEFARACRVCIHRVTWRRASAAELRGLRVPVLVIEGGRDRLVRGSTRRARLISDVRVVAIPDGGHLVLQECAEKTNRELIAFIEIGRGEQGRR